MTCPNCSGTLPDGAMFCGACGTKLAAADADPLVGKTVGGRYKILRRMGAGGMGTVYAGEQVSLKRPAAVKLLNPELFDQPDVVRRFHAEAELAARLSHPHTVTVYDFGQESDGSLFIAMELVTGQSLRQVLQRERTLTPMRAIDIAEQIAASLWDAHQHGIIHRDLKPDNVMLSERAGRRDFVRVLDFGIAKLRDERAGGVTALPQTHVGSLLGTPQYMAPEQITGAPADGRTDVYALGCMLYEMVTGKLVFGGPTLTAVLAQHLNEMPPPPDHARPDLGIPPGLSALVMRCLAKHPDLRPASMEVVKAELATLRGQLGWAPMPSPTAPAPVPAYGAAAVPTPSPPAPAPMRVPPPPAGGQTLKAGPRPAGAPSRLWLGALGIGVVMILAAILIGRIQWQWDPDIPEAEGAVPAGEEDDDDTGADEGSSGAGGTPATPPAALGMTDQALGKLFEGGGGLTSNPSGFGGRKPTPNPAPAGGGAGSMSNTKFGYTIDLPSGFAPQQSTDESTMAMGTIDGKPALIVSFAQPAEGSLFTDEAMDGLGDAVISNANARLVRKTKRRVGGRDLLAIIADMDQVGMRVEMVMFIRPTFILAVALGAQKDGFDRTVSMRDRFFTQSVRFR